jgi:zinc protease
MRTEPDTLLMVNTRLLRAILAILCFVLATIVIFSCNHAGKPFATVNRISDQSHWPHDSSDLLPDPGIEFGRLPNGLRYAIQENQTPKDRVSMHLFVRVGSLYERDEERGMAHFLEHMLFNGSKHFPPGEMVKYFQRIGMQFGPDANAHTGFDQTVYDVVLPSGGEKSLSEGLLVLRDYADGALLLPEEVAREKKVILAEMRSRDSARFRTLKASFGFEMPGLIVGQRFPIGEAEVIRRMDHQMLRDFYETWYRPERMFLILVGDLNKETAKRLIAERFNDLKAMQPSRPVPDFGRMAHTQVKGFHHYEKDAGAVTVAVETIVQEQAPLDSKVYQSHQMVQALANTMMQNRLDEMVRHPDAVLTMAGVGSGYYLGRIKYSEISGHTNAQNWEKAIADFEQALRKATLFGFTVAELNCAKKNYKAELAKAIEEERTRESKTLAQKIMAGISNWHVVQSPSQKAQIILPALNDVTLEQANQAFNQIWSAGHRLVLVTGNTNLAAGSASAADRIVTSYASSHKAKVDPPAERAVAVFPYLPPPSSPGVILKREEIKDLGITKVLLDNGIQLFLKPTRFKENRILATLAFGYGEASEPADQPGLAKLTQAVMNESCFGSMDRVAFEEALAGRLAKTEFKVKENMFAVKGEATPKELPLLFQLLRTFVLDPGFREESRQLSLKRFQQEHQRLWKSVEGVMTLKGRKFLAGGDHRFGTPEWSQMRHRTIDQMKSWIGPQLNNGSMELAVVGDFDVEQVIELASRYIGSLPKREAPQSVSPVSGPQFPKGKTLTLPVQTETPKALVVVAYPTEDFWDIHRTRRLSIMAELFSERLRQHVREQLGAAYSPYAYNRSYRAYKGYGMTQIFIQVEPKVAQTIVNEVQKIADQLCTIDIDADEFRRVLDPTLTHIKDLRQKNIYWLNSVLTGAARHPEQLEWARSFEQDYAAIRIEEISELAQIYLSNDNAATIILTPAE